jgi:hypothetical protein
VKLTLAPLLLLIFNVWAAGADAPGWNAKDSLAGSAVRVGVLLMLTVTGMLSGATFGAPTVITPLNCEGPVASAAGLTVTCRVAGSDDPKLGATLSQLPLSLGCALAVKLITLGSLVEMFTVCVTGSVLPAWKLNVNPLGIAEKGELPVVPVFSVTNTLRGEPPEESVGLITMNAPLVPEVGAVGPIETVRFKGVVPLLGVTCSQSAEVVIATLTDPAEVIISDCGGGGLPGCELNVSALGVA